MSTYGRLPEARVIHILKQICASLSEAHERGLVHRDVKPHNIFLTRRGNIPDFVKVLDFGLVKARNVDGEAELTGGNGTLGTPLYMSPEAVEHPGAVDARSDLYSLGAVGFYLLTGESLFFGGTVGEILMQQVKKEPEKPSARVSEPILLISKNCSCLAWPSLRPIVPEALVNSRDRWSGVQLPTNGAARKPRSGGDVLIQAKTDQLWSCKNNDECQRRRFSDRDSQHSK